MATRQADDNRQADRDKAAVEQVAEQKTRRHLLELVRDTVPPVPRKLNRIGELYGLYLGVAKRNDWDMKEARERLTLMRLVILQLLAPNLSRFGRRNRAFLLRMESWVKEHGPTVNLGRLEESVRDKIKTNEKKLTTNPTDLQAANDLYSLRRMDQQLLGLISEALNQRSGFDPFRLIDPDNPTDTELGNYYNLEKRFTTVERKGFFIADDMPTAAPTDPEGFFSQLFSTDRVAWQNAMEQEAEAMAGHVFDDSSFQALLDMVNRSPGFVTIDWLEMLEHHLTAIQLSQLFEASGLLGRLNEQLQQE